MVFLNEVADHSAENKMTISNLATLFGPTILRLPNQSPTEMLKDMQSVHLVTITLIQEYRTIFSVGFNF